MLRTQLTILQTRKDLVRSEKLDGRDYTVAPVVILVEGVHNKEFISYEEMSMFPDMWAGRPLPIDHPMDSDGQAVTANSPGVMESSVVGFFFNAIAREDLRGVSGEIWVDVEKAGRVPGGEEVLRKLQAGENLEVSTAYFTLFEKKPGEWQNPKGEAEKYTGIQYQIRPDHIALLPFDTGACNWEDGCGAPRTNNGTDLEFSTVKVNILSKARRPTFDGTETVSWASVKKTFSAYAKAYLKSADSSDDAPSSVADAPAAMKRWIAARTLLGDAAADNERDLIFFPVVNPATGRLNAGALRAVLGGRGAQADIPDAAKKSAQAMARRLLESEFGEDMTGNSLKINGKQLGKVLSGALEAASGDADEMITRLAVAAGIDETRVRDLVAGKLDFVPQQWCKVFAAVLDIDLWDLMMAASSDNTDARYRQDGPAAMTALHTSAVTQIPEVTTPYATNDSGTCDCPKTFKDRVMEVLKALGISKETPPITSEETSMAENVKADAATATPETETAPAATDTATATPAVNASAASNTPPAVDVKQFADQISSLIDEKFKALMASPEFAAVRDLASEKKNARTGKIAQLAATPKCPYTKDELETLSDAMLDKTLEMLQPSMAYRVAPAPRTKESDIPAPPAILLAKPGVKGVDYARQTTQNIEKHGLGEVN